MLTEVIPGGLARAPVNPRGNRRKLTALDDFQAFFPLTPAFALGERPRVRAKGIQNKQQTGLLQLASQSQNLFG
jgi:hypothetical protein